VRLIARDALTGRTVAIAVSAGTATAVDPLGSGPSPAGTPWLAPTFCDVQVNGALGVNFTDAGLTPSGVRTVADTLRSHGTGLFCPTIITAPFETVRDGLLTLTRTLEADSELARRVAGIHLEGPHISPTDGYRGAHPKEHVRPPDWDGFRRLQDAAGGRIRLVTLAPEWPDSLPFIENLRRSGVVVALGHTAADAVTLAAAIDAGATFSTHLGNGCAATIDRHHNPLWPQLADDRLTAGVIPDGHHLTDAILQCIVKVKSPARLAVTCDASPLAGLPPGRYAEWGQTFEVRPDGSVRIPGTPYLAGSGHFTDHCVSQLLARTQLSLADAVTAASVTPRRLLGRAVPELSAGAAWADFVLFDWHPGAPLVVRLAAGHNAG